MGRRGRSSLLVLLPVITAVTLPLLPEISHGENWPAWRGPQGNGVARDDQLPLEWGETRNVRWRVPLPDRGNSTPAIWGDRVFVTQAIEKDNRRTVMCFARGDGRLLWQTGVDADEREPTNGQNPYCSASPATDGHKVVAYFGSPGLFCFDAATGKELWRRELGKVDSWQGSGSSPVIDDGMCFLNASPGTGACLVACDLETGEVAWRVTPPKAAGGGARKPGEPAPPPPAKAPIGRFDDAMTAADPTGAGGYLGSWSTPLILRVDGRDQLVVVHPLQVTAYEPKTGREIWTYKGLAEQAFASPAARGDVLVVLGRPQAGGGTRATAVRLGGDAAGDVTTTHRLWETKLPKECVGSPVIAGDHVYLVTTFGSITCLDLASGKKLAEKRLAGTGSLGGSWSSIVLADDRLLVPNQSGEVFVFQPGPQLDLLASNTAGDEITCASPAVADGQLFLRTYRSLWCFEARRD
jgi:outer membrane protein assembly factor BamB